MSLNRRVMATVISLVASALTVLGLVIAATDHNPGGATRDPFTLNGYPPRSALVSLDVAAARGAGLHATLDVNFHRDAIDANVTFPMIFTTLDEEVRLVGHSLYLRSADVASGPWYAVPTTPPNLFGISLEMVRPDISLITGLTKRVTKNGYETTYIFSKRHVALRALGSASATSLGSLHWTIVTGAYGEVLSSELRVHSGGRTSVVSLHVLKYNQPAVITAPRASQVQSVSRSFVRQIQRSLVHSGVMIPDLSQLTTGSVA